MKLFVTILLCLSPVWTLRKVPDSAPISGRIIGGSVATPGQYPWLAAIYIDKPEGRFFCEGSVYTDQWILTAAQCVYGATSFTIQLGSNTLEGDDPNRVVLTSTTSTYEPRFDPEGLEHDIGFIKLDTPLTFNDYIQPVDTIEGAAVPVYDGVEVEIAGWGQIADTGDLVNELNFVYTTVLGRTKCQTYLGDQLFGTMCCTGGDTALGFCFGDTGSPLMAPAPVGNNTIQVAIASFITINGCESNDPKGYTKIDAYYNWMVNVTGIETKQKN